MFTNWSSVALVSFHGCDKVVGNGYILGLEEPLPSGEVRSSPTMGNFEFPTWHCVSPNPQRWATYFFFTTFAILAGMVVLSLFIGVITIGMFSEYNKYTDEQDTNSYNKGVEEATQALANPESVLRMAVDFAMGIENVNVAEKLIVQETVDGIVFRLRTTHDGKTEAEKELSHDKKIKLRDKTTSMDVSVDGGAPPTEVNDVMEPSTANKTALARLRPATFMKTSSVGSINSAGSDFLAKVKAQDAKTRKAVFVSVDSTFFYCITDAVAKRSQKLDASQRFQNVITLAILTAGLTVGLDTDNRGDSQVLWAVDFSCLVLFTFECTVKILACGKVLALYMSKINFDHSLYTTHFAPSLRSRSVAAQVLQRRLEQI